MKKVIFLDLDGVMNGYGIRTYTIYKVLDKLHMVKYIRKVYDLFGIRIYKVFLLKIITNATGAKVVLSSSWRSVYGKEYKKGTRAEALNKRFNMFHIPVIGSTPYVKSCNRKEEIYQYLEYHPEVDKFIILDDETFGFDRYLISRTIKTSKTNLVTGSYRDETGLRIHHVIKAIKMLNE